MAIDTGVFSRFFQSKQGQEIARQAEKAETERVLAERVAAARDIEAITDAELVALKQYEQARGPLLATETKLAMQLATVREQLCALDGQYGRAKTDLWQRKERCQVILYSTRHRDVLVAFHARLRPMIEQALLDQCAVRSRGIDGFWYSRWTNEKSVQARIKAILDLMAITRDELPYELRTEAELSAHCETLMAALPPIDAPPELSRGEEATYAASLRGVHA